MNKTMYVVTTNEKSCNFIEIPDSLIGALDTVKYYESKDKRKGCYIKGLYDVIDQDKKSYYLNPLSEKLYETGEIVNGLYFSYCLTNDYEEARNAYEALFEQFFKTSYQPDTVVYFGEYTVLDDKIVIHLDSSECIEELIDTYSIDINIEHPVLDCVIYRSGCDPKVEPTRTRPTDYFDAVKKGFIKFDPKYKLTVLLEFDQNKIGTLVYNVRYDDMKHPNFPNGFDIGMEENGELSLVLDFDHFGDKEYVFKWAFTKWGNKKIKKITLEEIW